MDSLENYSRCRRNGTQPAVAVPLAAPGGRLLFHVTLLSTAWAGQQILAIQMPKMPNISLPGFGGSKDKAKEDKPPPATPTPSGGVKARTENSPKIAGVTIPLPKLPNISLPGFGSKDKAKEDAPAPRPPVTRSDVKVRAAMSPRAQVDAPTLAEVIGKREGPITIGSAEGWKRFRGRRMPGANMDPWKEISREITPKL